MQELPISSGVDNLDDFNAKSRSFVTKAREGGASNFSIANGLKFMFGVFQEEQKNKMTDYQQADIDLRRDQAGLGFEGEWEENDDGNGDNTNYIPNIPDINNTSESLGVDTSGMPLNERYNAEQEAKRNLSDDMQSYSNDPTGVNWRSGDDPMNISRRQAEAMKLDGIELQPGTIIQEETSGTALKDIPGKVWDWFNTPRKG